MVKNKVLNKKIINYICIAACDKFFAILAVMTLLPLLLFVCIAIFFTQGSPIFFSQERTGKDQRTFKILKFRSMKRIDSETVEQAHLEKHRITKFGGFLRATNFDELPQLFNILKGDMSFVGPRPHEKKQDEKFSIDLPSYKKRHSTKPGLTGLAQVSSYSGPIIDDDFLRKRVAYDIVWCRDPSLKRYINIWLCTLKMGLVMLLKKIR